MFSIRKLPPEAPIASPNATQLKQVASMGKANFQERRATARSGADERWGARGYRPCEQ